MPIPEAQLSTWSNQGAVQTSSATYASIQAALDAFTSWPKGLDREIYLQGSYCNSTNIRGDSDVDVVVQLNSTFDRDLTALSASEQQAYTSAFSKATYLWADFQQDVLKALRAYYGTGNVDVGKKCLKVKGGSGRLPADVVVAMEHRKYLRFRSIGDQSYVSGMTFYVPSEDRWVVNFPKVHRDNGAEKNNNAGKRYKPNVRVYKNARTYMINNSLIASDLAPSYFLECLMYNVPDYKYAATFAESFCNIINWLNTTDLTACLCQNEQVLLFGNTPEQWNTEKARVLIASMINLWNKWPG